MLIRKELINKLAKVLFVGVLSRGTRTYNLSLKSHLDYKSKEVVNEFQIVYLVEQIRPVVGYFLPLRGICRTKG